MVKKPAYIPEKGDVVWLDFDPQAGHEQGGRRPAFVLSPAIYNSKTGLMLCCPITTQIKGYPFEVAVEDAGNAQGVILADQVKSLDWQVRRAEKKGAVSKEILKQVMGKIMAILEG
ncbi:endoribonuclease MazF [Geomonas sp.]|uniref:endoribonuclease MazF n=1 Tax=Geomonas sp. TaxID=2651584 RepID=UPI002B481CF8|nr:endoribonuclease MazF [Geomonas sp.]HJV33962.1 endoribonuclease MazF [Geomonas sp.]